MTTCSSCGSCCDTGATQCNNCCAEHDTPDNFVDSLKYVTGKDACGRNQNLNNKECGVLTSSGSESKFRDGSVDDKICLKFLQEVQGLDTLIGLSGGSLAKLTIDDGEIAQKTGGKITSKPLVFSPKFQLTDVPAYVSQGVMAMLTPDSGGNLILERLDAPFNGALSVGEIAKDHIWTFNGIEAPTPRKYQDLNLTVPGPVVYYWDNVKKTVVHGPAPIPVGLQTLADFRLRLNATTGHPEWVLEVTPTDFKAAMGTFTFPQTTFTNTADQPIVLSKVFDGAGVLDPRYTAGSCVIPSKTGQLQVIATGQAQAVSAGGHQPKLFWKLNGTTVSNPQGQVFAAVANAGPILIAHWAGNVVAGDSLCLFARDDVGTVNLFAGSVTANHLPPA